MSLFIQLIEGSTVPEPAFDFEIIGIGVQGDGIGTVSLQFYRVCPGFGRFINDLQSRFKLAVMVGGQLRNYVRRLR